MIGIYYFKDGNRLKQELKYLIDNNIMKGGEYQLPDALRRLTEAGYKLKPGTVSEWLDCGNKEVTVYTNQRVLEFDWEKNKNLVSKDLKTSNSVIIPPCYIGEDVVIENSIVGPHVSLGKGPTVTNSIIRNTIVQTNAQLNSINLSNSMIGSHTKVNGKSHDLSLGDYSTLQL
jgi:glucose-1-phosphate thymidylyltransferase